MDPSFPFPAGANSTETIINGVRFNLSILKIWNYTLYANETLSNESNCWLVFEPYTPPLVLLNGTFINATSCYVPIRPIEAQGITALVFGILFAASIVFTLINLRKHGRSFLPRDKRWNVVGRRWQWYWMLFVSVCGIISSFTGIDVDRDYLQSAALMLRSFFYTLMFPGTIACVWEATRHWNSWQERQLCDADCFALQPHDLRSKKEFYMPLVFYLFDWLVFFMTIPRPWSAMQKQRSPSQTEIVARPMATDVRFKAGSLLAFGALVVICYCLRHSMKHYHLLRQQKLNVLLSIFRYLPSKLVFGILVLSVRIGYAVVSAWKWSISPYRVDAGIVWLYGLGYGPALLLLLSFNIYGFIEENDDRILISQRVRRNRTADHELGITSRKPSWWSKSHSKAAVSAEEMLREMAFENRSGSLTAVASNVDEDHSGKWWWQKRGEEQERQNYDRGTTSANSSTYAHDTSMLESVSSTTALRTTRVSSVTESEQSYKSRESRPQVIRSMLNV